jgi:hypothetical protein
VCRVLLSLKRSGVPFFALRKLTVVVRIRDDCFFTSVRLSTQETGRVMLPIKIHLGAKTWRYFFYYTVYLIQLYKRNWCDNEIQVNAYTLASLLTKCCTI